MKKHSFKIVLLFLLVLCLIILSFKDSVYPVTNTSIPLESNSRGIAINPITAIAVVTNKKADSVFIVEKRKSVRL